MIIYHHTHLFTLHSYLASLTPFEDKLVQTFNSFCTFYILESSRQQFLLSRIHCDSFEKLNRSRIIKRPLFTFSLPHVSWIWSGSCVYHLVNQGRFYFLPELAWKNVNKQQTGLLVIVIHPCCCLTIPRIFQADNMWLNVVLGLVSFKFYLTHESIVNSQYKIVNNTNTYKV